MGISKRLAYVYFLMGYHYKWQPFRLAQPKFSSWWGIMLISKMGILGFVRNLTFRRVSRLGCYRPSSSFVLAHQYHQHPKYPRDRRVPYSFSEFWQVASFKVTFIFALASFCEHGICRGARDFVVDIPWDLPYYFALDLSFDLKKQVMWLENSGLAAVNYNRGVRTNYFNLALLHLGNYFVL